MAQSIAFDIIARDKASSTFTKISKASDSTSKRLVRFGRSTAGLLGLTSLTTAALGFVKVGADYSASLNKIQALTGVTDARMKQVASTLQSQSGAFAKMGQTTGDAANGVVELTKAGLSLHSSLKAVSATMVLAKAGELSVADASSLVANTLNTFGLKASHAGDIANYLANAANISSADVTDLAESLKYVAPVAASTGVSLKDTAAILAELSNSGIAASNAGTGFRKFLLSLQAPSGAAAKDLKALGVEIFDSSGKMKPLGKVIDILDKSMSKLTDKQRQRDLKDIFGLQGISSASVILKNGSKGLEQYAKGVTRAGAAQKLAEAGSKGFMGTLKQLRAEVISSAQAEYRKLEPALNAAAQKLTAFVEQMRTGKGTGGDFVAVIKTLATVVKDAVKFLDGLPGPVKKFGIEGLIAYGVLTKLTAATSGWGASMSLGVAKVKQFGAEMTYTTTRMDAISRASYALGGALRQLGGVGGMLLLTKSMSEVDDSARTMERTLGGALAGFAVGGPLGAAVGGFTGFASAVVSSGHRSAKAFSAAQAAADDYAGSLGVLTGALTKNSHAEVVNSLTKNNDSAVRAANALGISTDVLARSLTGGAKAQKVVNQAIREGILSGKMMTYENGGQARASDVLKQALHGMSVETSTGTKHTKGLTQAFRDAHKEAALEAKKGRELASALKGIPTKVATQIVQPNGPQSLRDIEKLIDKYHRTPSQVRTLIKALNVDVTDAQLRVLINHSKTLDQMKPTVSVSAKTSQARADLSSFYSYLVSVTKDRTVNVHVKSGKAGGVGNLLGQTVGKGGRGSSRMTDAGRNTAGAFADGIHLGAMKVKRALSKLQDMASAAMSKIADLKNTRQGFLDTFKSDSIFGADLSNGGGIGDLIAMQQKQAAQATQLMADIKRVTSMGLSKSLVSQLQSQGTSGAEALHALAGGSAAQIQQLNALNAQTQSSLQSAGMLAGNTVRGGNINADIAAAQHQDVLIEKLIRRLQHMNEEIVVEIDGEAIVRAIKRRNKRKGVSSAGL